MEEKNRQDKDFWDKFCKLFHLDVQVNVPKKVTKEDIILSLLKEGDFIFVGRNGAYSRMNLNQINAKMTKERVKLFKEILWNPVEDYLKRALKTGGKE